MSCPLLQPVYVPKLLAQVWIYILMREMFLSVGLTGRFFKTFNTWSQKRNDHWKVSKTVWHWPQMLAKSCSAIYFWYIPSKPDPPLWLSSLLIKKMHMLALTSFFSLLYQTILCLSKLFTNRWNYVLKVSKCFPTGNVILCRQAAVNLRLCTG